jgi:hypothetical protein
VPLSASASAGAACQWIRTAPGAPMRVVAGRQRDPHLGVSGRGRAPGPGPPSPRRPSLSALASPSHVRVQVEHATERGSGATGNRGQVACQLPEADMRWQAECQRGSRRLGVRSESGKKQTLNQHLSASANHRASDRRQCLRLGLQARVLEASCARPRMCHFKFQVEVGFKLLLSTLSRPKKPGWSFPGRVPVRRAKIN